MDRPHGRRRVHRRVRGGGRRVVAVPCRRRGRSGGTGGLTGAPSPPLVARTPESSAEAYSTSRAHMGPTRRGSRMKPYRILITGSRDWTDENLIRHQLTRAWL